MQKFQTLSSLVIPLPFSNVDTDQIIPARYLKVINKDGLADGLFYKWRYISPGTLNLEFPLNQEMYKGSQIMVTGDNFGCGSSREHAPWALMSWGIRALISTSFADIFYNNALKNGLLPIVVEPATVDNLFALIKHDPFVKVTIDLSEQTIVLQDGKSIGFPLDPFSKHCLLQGIDQLEYLLQHEHEIERYELVR